MRILFLMPWNPDFGCIKKWHKYLKLEIEKLGHETRVFSPYNLPYPINKIAVFFIYFPFFYRIFGFAWEVFVKIFLYLPIALSLAIFNDCMISYYPPDSFILQIMFKLFRKKNISVVHQARNEKHKGYRLFLWKVYYKLCDGLIAISKSAKEDIENIYKIKGDKITVIYNGLNLDEFNNVSNDTLNLTGNPALLYVGRLEYVKGIDILIHAFNIVKKKYNKAFLHVLGDGSKKEELVSLVKKLGLDGDVKFYGIVVPPYSYMKAADILVIPSRYDALPTVALEAMACGIPIVVSDVGGLKEIIKNGENGLKAKPKPYDIAEKIIFLWGNKKLRKHIKENQFIFIKNFSWERVAREYLEYIKEIM